MQLSAVSLVKFDQNRLSRLVAKTKQTDRVTFAYIQKYEFKHELFNILSNSRSSSFTTVRFCYFREMQQIKNNPHSERENHINEAMVRQNKHVFFADRLQECVHEHVRYQGRRGHAEPLSAPRMFVIYDNVEASEPGDTSDYSAVLDAPFYKLRIEDCKEQGRILSKIK